MSIYFAGHHIFERREILSTYLVGMCDRTFYRKQKDIYSLVGPEYLNQTRIPYIEFKILDQFLREHRPALSAWLNERQVQFGGYFYEMGPGSQNGLSVARPSIIREFPLFDIYLLLIPGSNDELAFKLAWQITNAEEILRNSLDNARQNDALSRLP